MSAPSNQASPENLTQPLKQKIDHDFNAIAPDTFIAKLRVSTPDRTQVGEAVQRAVFGNPISQRMAAGERLGRAQALAILSSDALSSVAYGTEASLAVLIVAGAAALNANLGIGLVIVILMAIVATSYRQTIFAYPNGGGSYVVASENFRPVVGLVAGAALLIDYLLTVAVSVSAGIDAIASAFPLLSSYTVVLDVAAIILITLINLRGVREAGRVFVIPTYAFLGSFGLMIVVGIIRALFSGGLFTHAAVGSGLPGSAAFLPTSLVTLTPLLILTAFASGSSAMTGIEAISNGVPIFQGEQAKDRSRNAAATLIVMITLLISLFVGTTYLAWRIGAIPSPTGQPTITSQIATYAYAGWLHPLFYLVQAATLLILVFAANTSFAGFPRLAAFISQDGYLPAALQHRGERDAFNFGIISLGVLSTILVIIFRGRVTELINLYAMGVFTAFTLSQAGMVVHWYRRRQTESQWRIRAAINGLGAAMTLVVTLVIAITKFDRGGWVVVILIPVLVAVFLAIHAYYSQPRHLQITDVQDTRHFDAILIPIFSHRRLQSATAQDPGRQTPGLRLTDVLDQELDYAASFHPKAIILPYIVFDRQEVEDVRAKWGGHLAELSQRYGIPIRLQIVISPYRTYVLPMAHFIRDEIQQVYVDKHIGIMLPRQLHIRWWEYPLHRFVAERVRQQLLQDDVSTSQIIDLPFTIGNQKVAG